MPGLRQHVANGPVRAISADDLTYVDQDGTHFARRSGETFQMADGTVGRLGGTVVFIKDADQKETAAFWLETESNF